MKHNKPYLLKRNFVPNSHIMDFPTQERKTNSSIFTYGKKLPFTLEGSNFLAPQQDPKEYDLVYQSLVLPEIFLKYDFLPTNKPALVVNKKIIDILTSVCPNDIQTFPAVIAPEKPNKMTFENHDYWVLNLTNTVDVIDEEHSVYDVAFENRITNIKKLCFIEENNYNFYIGRQYNYPLHVILSPELVKIFKKEKVTGVKFIKDSEFSR